MRKNQPLWAKSEKTADARPLIMALVANALDHRRRDSHLFEHTLDGAKNVWETLNAQTENIKR